MLKLKEQSLDFPKMVSSFSDFCLIVNFENSDPIKFSAEYSLLSKGEKKSCISIRNGQNVTFLLFCSTKIAYTIF